MIESTRLVVDTFATQSELIKAGIDTITATVQSKSLDSLVVSVNSATLDSIFATLQNKSNDSIDIISIAVPLLSLLIALLALIFGRLNVRDQIKAQLKVSEDQIESNAKLTDKQIRETALTDHRLKIRSLLVDSLSDLMSLISYMTISDNLKNLSEETKAEKSRELLFHLNKCRLLLEPENAIHRDLYVTLEKTVDDVGKGITQLDEKNLQEIMINSHTLLREEMKELRQI